MRVVEENGGGVGTFAEGMMDVGLTRFWHGCRRVGQGMARNRGRPFLRWVDDINDFIAVALGDDSQGKFDTWAAVAQEREKWAALEQDYINFCSRKRG